jgi:superfamily II DNA/RNA helicase
VQIDNPQEKHVNIKQVLFWADNAQHKRKLLDHWLRDTTINQAIVFASTQSSATAWPTTCSKTALTPWPCTAP